MLHEDIHQAATEGRLPALQSEARFTGPQIGGMPNFIQVVIREVIFDPQSQMTDDFIAYLRHEVGVSNIKFAKSIPRNTIVGQKILSDGTRSEPPMFFLPWLPSHLAVPCKPGEHVWVFLDAPDHKRTEIGWWAWKVVGFDHTDDVNHSHAPRNYDEEFYKSNSSKNLAEGNSKPIYDFLNGSGDSDDKGARYAVADTATIDGDYDAYEHILTGSKASKLVTYESVPRYKKRPGDFALEGSNNQVIIFGTDRVNTTHISDENNNNENGPDVKRNPKDISGPGTGFIDITVGRGQTDLTSGISVQNSLNRQELGKSDIEKQPNEGNPDFKNDRSRIFVSSKTMIDSNLDLNQFNSSFLSSDPTSAVKDRGENNSTLTSQSSGDGAIGIKSDKLRLVARSDLVLYVTSYDRDENGNMKSKSEENWACIAVKSNGDIVVKPGATGAILLGGEDADKGLMIANTPCQLDRASGKVSGAPMISTMGGAVCTQVPGQGGYADRLLVKST